MRLLAIFLSTALFASVGIAIGAAIHGPSPWVLVQAAAGAAGGLGMGWAGLNVVDRWREEAGRNGRASSGWAGSLEAASDARVDVLLFSNGVSHEAFQCPSNGPALPARRAATSGTRASRRAFTGSSRSRSRASPRRAA